MAEIIRIPDGNAFLLRVTGQIRTGDYTEDADFSVVTHMGVNFVRRGRIAQTFGLDSLGRIVIENSGNLAQGVYGVELYGYYHGEPWRNYQKNVFQIVNENANSDPGSDNENVLTYDVTFDVTFGGDGISAAFVEATVATHNGDEESHPDLREEIEEKQDVIDDLATIRSGAAAGSMAYQKPASGIPEADMADGVKEKLAKADAAYQKPGTGIPSADLSAEVQDMIENGGKTKSVSVNGGTPVTPDANGQVDLTIEQANVTIGNVTTGAAGSDAEVHNSGTPTAPILDFVIPKGDDGGVGPQGPRGDSAVYNPDDPDTPDFVMANTTGQSTTKAMTQKAVTDIIDDIKREITHDGSEDEILVTDDSNNYVGHINDDGAVFKGLRVGDKTSSEEVLTTPVSQEFNNYESGNLEIADDNGIFVGEINNEGLIIKNLKIGDKTHGFDIMQHPTLQLSDVLNDNDLFIKHDKLINATGAYKTNNGFSASSLVNIDGIVLIEYIGLHPLVTSPDVYSPILLYDENFSIISPIYMEGSGKVYMSDYPDAKYAVFNNNGDDSAFEIKMYVQSEQIKAKRKDIKVGAYYFAGWSETDFPNIHHTEALLNTYAEREPSWGWLDHGSTQGDGWLITPQISLGSGITTLTILHSCLFYKDGQCSVCVREIGGTWVGLTPTMPSSTKTTMTSTNVDLSAFAGKNVQVGFHIHTSPGDESAIWTINRLTVVSGGSTVYDKNYTNHANFDCEITNNDVWKPATWTRAYDNLNGYVGTTVNQKDTSVIDKQIVLAKRYGIDYFMLEWFYYDDQSTFNEEASYAEDNHIAVHAFMKSCQKYGFSFALMITNHSPFRIVGLQNWKDAIAYLDREYFHDPSYLVIDNKPVLYIFDKTEYRNAGPANINDYFIELGWDGVYMLLANYNTIPNSGELVERDIDDLYQQNKTWNETNYVNSYLYNFVTTITCGWDSRPWAERPGTYARPTDWFVPDINKWRAHFDWAYRFAKIYSNSLFKSVLICAWNEYGEGSYLAPTKKDSSMLRVVNDVISNNKK